MVENMFFLDSEHVESCLFIYVYTWFLKNSLLGYDFLLLQLLLGILHIKYHSKDSDEVLKN